MNNTGEYPEEIVFNSGEEGIKCNSIFRIAPINGPVRNFNFLEFEGGIAEQLLRFTKIRICHKNFGNKIDLENYFFIGRDFPLTDEIKTNIKTIDISFRLLINESDANLWYFVISKPDEYLMPYINPFSINSLRKRKRSKSGIYIPLLFKCKRSDFLRHELICNRKDKLTHLKIFLQVELMIDGEIFVDFIEIPFKRNMTYIKKRKRVKNMEDIFISEEDKNLSYPFTEDILRTADENALIQKEVIRFMDKKRKKG